MSGSRHANPQTFGQGLRTLRAEQQKSLAALSADSNVSRSYLGNLEHDRSVPGPEIAAAIDAALSAGGRLIKLAAPKPRTRPARDRVRPDQLPVAIRGFTPRAELLKEAEEALATHAGVIAFDGPAGVGKTAFAVTWAHSIADAFPDGVLFADLRGYAADPPDAPAFVLRGFLRSLGIAPSDIPSDLAERAALYRTLLAGTRTLVVLDNAVDDEQVRQLLPGSASCLAVITSRNRLSGVVVREGAVRITVQPMTADEAHELLRSVVGPRIDTDLDAAQVIADRAGRLPLALRIAAERASRWLNTPLRALANELARRQPLDVFAVNDTLAVRTVLSYSHDALPAKMSNTFRLLGLHPGGPVRIEAAAALMDQPPSQALGHLSALASIHLLDQTTEDRFVMHDLVHSYALELAREHNSHQDNAAALERLVRFYLTTGAAATRILWPSRPRSGLSLPKNDLTTLMFRDPAQALNWFEEELRLLVQLVRCGARWNVTSVAYLPVVISEMLCHRRAWSWWMPALWEALAMARQGGHRDAEAWILETLGDASIDADDKAASMNLYREAMAIRAELDDCGGLAIGHVGLAKAFSKVGAYDAAIAHCENARKISVEVDDMWQYSVATAHLAMARAALGLVVEARDLLSATRVALDDAGDLMSSGRVAMLQAKLAETAGEHGLAVQHLDDALRIFGRVGDVWSQTHIHSRLGALHANCGDHRAARRARVTGAELLTGDIEPAATRYASR
ncbi:NB-ARC domain-containing protein [Lentzea sp. BCCO 10_0798]|uniref:NB-ARC domain-containing protein n=1 Tax=Lentzea kristufekii TaxID=3095430 RepID=A0ABU4U108_9PSEU|nr:NB-ARC domain-containing protein [Lentzea sp. BCCO 10_0798]MDX8053802.1 NB-ARC domain-containing protein [Lentzea sp. BCCO 10_0798]